MLMYRIHQPRETRRIMTECRKCGGRAEWRNHADFPGYEISSDGRVRSLNRWITYRNGVRRSYKGQDLSPTLTRYGYHLININICNVSLKRTAHSLVMETFVGPRPTGFDIRHLDGDKIHNCVNNLVYGSRSENILDAVQHGTHRQTRKMHCDSGHALTEENIYWSKTGRCCRECRKTYTNNYYARNKDAVRERRKIREAARS